MINIRCIKSDEAYKIWDMVTPFFVSAMKKWIPLYRSEDLLEGIEKGAMQLWTITDDEKQKLYGATLTQVHPYPLAKVLHLYLTGGNNMNLWKDQLAKKLEDFAREEGCRFMQIFGRRGWMSFGADAWESGVVLHKLLD